MHKYNTYNDQAIQKNQILTINVNHLRNLEAQGQLQPVIEFYQYLFQKFEKNANLDQLCE